MTTNKTNGYDKCTGCHVCTLCCPVFQQTHDNLLTVFGRARALQGGAAVKDIMDSIGACILCGACEPACPFEIDTVDFTLSVRAEIAGKNDPSPVEKRLTFRQLWKIKTAFFFWLVTL
jgi:Fe-S oxidoreductase